MLMILILNNLSLSALLAKDGANSMCMMDSYFGLTNYVFQFALFAMFFCRKRMLVD
jgi:hypothetical protein